MKFFGSNFWGAGTGGTGAVFLYGPTTSVVGYASAPFTVVPSPAYTGTITPDDSGAGGTFAPTSLSFVASTTAQTFTYTAASTGAKSIAITASPSLTLFGSPITLTVGSVAQLFEQAFVARLSALTGITSIVGTAIYKDYVPQTHDLGAAGPALTYSIPTKPMQHVLTGSDGVAIARAQVDAWSYSESSVKNLMEQVRLGIDGKPTAAWGDGSCVIMSVVQQDDTDADEPPKAGSDQVMYHSLCEYNVKYRVVIPTLP